ncbi:hypothetical protein L596_001534 [Steinernema carpocapsae]|uniref:Uncharacterized protein n=1 Tax=Steinernema carpocapsae TaxID=34508 RepID=A0A4V6I758_STECR|nr:hypothetical protein L596_001534 [Steinernema carpocapsae]
MAEAQQFFNHKMSRVTQRRNVPSSYFQVDRGDVALLCGCFDGCAVDDRAGQVDQLAKSGRDVLRSKFYSVL